MARTKEPCPIVGCPRTHPSEYVMCAVHWRRVSPPTQRAVYAAYASYLAGDVSLGHLRDVQDDAIKEASDG